MSRIIVTPLSALPASIRHYRPSRVVTLLSPEHMIDTPEGFADEHHLKLPVNDIAEAWAGESPPAETHIHALLKFGRAWDADAPILVHCWAGVSRSMAAAYTILCDRLGPGQELAIAREVRARAPHADPNRLIVRLADEMLGRDGRMVEAVELIGRGVLVTEGVPVELPLVLPVRAGGA
jgi:predicted protein tyrosine phosphatase